jgi:hypothetical protein
MTGKSVNQRRLPDIGAADKGKFRQPVLRTLFDFGATADKRCGFDKHRQGLQNKD